MNSRERLLHVLHGKVPDCVPCCPDISNMVPCRLTGKPFWDVYLFNKIPLWRAYIDAAKYYDIDAGFEVYSWGDVLGEPQPKPRPPRQPGRYQRKIVERNDERIIVRTLDTETGKWTPWVGVFPRDATPAGTTAEHYGMPETPTEWEDFEVAEHELEGMELWRHIREEIGDQGVIGLGCGATTGVIAGPDDIHAYHDDPQPFHERRDRIMADLDDNMEKIAGMKVKPDFLFCGASGSLIWQTPAMFRELALPILKKATDMACDIGIPTHVHSCGPQKEMVKMAVEETKLTVIDPLEIPPMGDCILAELKQRYGDKIVLKGNLHTTETMLRGSVDDVVEASKKAIDDAAAGGRFILSTGDQCGRDTPDENIRAMVQTARTYGRY